MKESSNGLVDFNGLIDTLVHGGFFLEEAVEILEKGMIGQVLRRTENNQSEASKILGIHRNTLLRKMLLYGIDGKHPRRKPVAVAAAAKPVRRTRRA